ncbi:hypothetical protein NMY22_g8467 [Coprinellus aureogranulatus]|nr:hypothetical protein NMY22_g8467 [Coprinellus aureogranulatus]
MHKEHLAVPREILDLILDHVAQEPRNKCLPTLRSCSLAHSTFVASCQKRIFIEVSLLSPPTDPGLIQMLPFVRGLSFVDTVTRNSRLASYVERLTYFLCEGDLILNFADYHLKKKQIVDAIATLPNLTHLAIRPAEMWPYYSLVSIDDETMGALLSILQRGHLRSLILHRVRCGVEILPAVGHLETLTLFHIRFIDADHLATPRSSLANDRKGKRVRDLTCDDFSYEEVNQYLSRMEEDWRNEVYTGPGDSTPFGRVERLAIYVFDSQGTFIVDPSKLFQQATCLQSLSITCGLEAPRIIEQDQAPLSPLQELNTSSFTTLTYLSIRLLIHLNRPHFAILHPYCGLCESSLPKLQALQSFCIQLILQGHFNVDESSFGTQWGQLPDALTKTGAFPHLKEVAVGVMIRVPLQEGDDDAYPPTKDAADDLRHRLAISVYPAQFQALEARNAEGSLTFTFEIEVSTGPWIYLRGCAVKEREKLLYGAPRSPVAMLY